MAVPKKKRSRQMVAIRRSNSLIKLFNKYNILKKNSASAFISSLTNKENKYNSIAGCDFNNPHCGYYSGSKTKKVCLDCYSSHFSSSFSKYIHKK